VGKTNSKKRNVAKKATIMVMLFKKYAVIKNYDIIIPTFRRILTK